MQGNRFYDLLRSTDQIDVYLFNTGFVGGREGCDYSKKVVIKHSSTILENIMLNTISWVEDGQFGYFIAVDVPGMDDEDLINPKRLFAKQKREAEYLKIVQQIHLGRMQYMNQFEGLYACIKEAI